MKRFATIPVAVLLAACAPSVQSGSGTPAGSASQPPVPMTNMPIKYTARPTVAAITAPDLMSRLYVFADDSMGGRQVGTDYNLKGAAYIAGELQKLGIKPGGLNGSYYQDVPVGARNLDLASTLTVEGRALKAGTDFIATGGSPAGVKTLQTVYIGQALDTMNVPSRASLAGKLVVLRPNAPFTSQDQVNALLASDGYKRYTEALKDVGGTATISPTEALSAANVRNATASTGTQLLSASGIHAFQITPATAAAILGAPVADVAKGTAGKAVTADLRFNETRKPARNVIGIIEGSDPKLKGQFVAFGAHNDHVGFTTPVEHDSLRAHLTFFQKGGAESTGRIPAAQRTPEMIAAMNRMKDSLRQAHGGIRMDSIQNGADDDGSGSMAVLEIAEAFAKSGTKPKRSLLFLWYTGEEMGMWGSGHFVDHPTVPRDSIVAALNIDMIGRGAAEDTEGGGPAYMQLLGSRRISREYGDLVEQVNVEKNAGFKFDYQFDAAGHPQQYYCRSDHWSFARWGIPVTFFSTGGHRDYHQRTDEPQYINYPHYVKVTQFIHDVGERVANLDHNLKVDGPRPDGKGQCVQ